jgi:hypothetical protein
MTITIAITITIIITFTMTRAIRLARHFESTVGPGEDECGTHCRTDGGMLESNDYGVIE